MVRSQKTEVKYDIETFNFKTLDFQLIIQHLELKTKSLQHYNIFALKKEEDIFITTLPLKVLEKSFNIARKNVKKLGIGKKDMKERAIILRNALQNAADKENIKLKLQKPPNWK